jgi:hypothetical protein
MADKNTYYITLQPKVDKNTIKDMENKFNAASKNISKNLSNSLKSAIKGSALAMVGAFGVGSMLSNVISDIVDLPNKTKSVAMDLRSLAIQTKNVAMIGDLTSGQFASFYQGLQSAGFTGDINDVREVFAETAKSKAKDGKFEGQKVGTGEILAQVLQQWQEVGRKYGTDSVEFQNAKKEVEQIIGGVDTARKFESLVKGEKNIGEIIKQGQSELDIKVGSSKIYDKNVEVLKGLSAQSQEAKMQKFLFNKEIDKKSIEELNKILDSDLTMALSGLSDSQKLSSQIQISNTIKETQMKVMGAVIDIAADVSAIVKFINQYLKKNKKTEAEIKYIDEKTDWKRTAQYGVQADNGNALGKFIADQIKKFMRGDSIDG